MAVVLVLMAVSVRAAAPTVSGSFSVGFNTNGTATTGWTNVGANDSYNDGNSFSNGGLVATATGSSTLGSALLVAGTYTVSFAHGLPFATSPAGTLTVSAQSVANGSSTVLSTLGTSQVITLRTDTVWTTDSFTFTIADGDAAIGRYLKLTFNHSLDFWHGLDSIAVSVSGQLTPSAFALTEDVAGNLTYTGTPFADADSTNLTVTLSVADGTITGNAGTGITVAGSATARTFAGTIADLNTYFATAGKITYLGLLNNTTSRTLTTAVSDGTQSVSATSTMNFTAVNDVPSFTTLGAFVSAGTTWTARESSRAWNCIASSNDGTKLAAVVQSGYIYTSTDSGVTWTPRLTDANRSWWSVASSADGTKLAAAESYGQIYTSTDSGVTWTSRGTAGDRFFIASSADGTKLVATTANGGAAAISTSTDSGQTWTSGRDSARNWWGVASSADGVKLAAVAYGGQIYTSTNSGLNWTAQASGNHEWRSIASSADGVKLAAAGVNCGIYTSADSGATWTARESVRSWWSIASSADGMTLAAVAEGAQIYISADAGVTWTARGTSGAWRAIASSADGTKLAAAPTTGQIYTSADSTVSRLTVAVGSGAYAQSNFATSLSAGPADESAQTWTFGLTNTTNGIFAVQPALSSTGTLTFTPHASTTGTATVTITMTDSAGASSATQTLAITVASSNTAPTLSAIALSGTEDTTLTFTAANFTSVYTDTEGAPLASITVVSLPATGLLKLSGVNVTASQVITAADLPNLTYVPAANENGAKTFTVKASDGSVLSTSATTVTMTLAAVTDAPSIAAIAVSGTEDTTLTFTAANFTNAYVDGTALVSIRVATLPATGLLQLSNVNVSANQVITAANLPNLTYVPAANENGAKTFTVTASDGATSSAAATVTMNLTVVNDVPSFTLGARRCRPGA